MAPNAVHRFITLKNQKVDFIGWNIKRTQLNISTSYILNKDNDFFHFLSKFIYD